MDIPLTTKVQAVKDLVLKSWPEDCPQPCPGDAAEVKLILNGKVLENGKTLADYKTPTGMMVTCHLLIRPKPEPPKQSAATKAEKQVQKCTCVVQ